MKRLIPLLLLVLCAYACSKNPEKEQEENKPNQPPSAFQASVSNVTPSAATISWTASVDPEGKPILYSIIIGTDTVSRKQSTTSFNATNLKANLAYTGTVIAYDAEGLQANASFSFSTTDLPAPSDFIVSYSDVGRNYIVLSWTASTLPNNAPVTYDVYLNNQLIATNITATTYTCQSLTENTSYTPKVVAKSSGGKSTERTALAVRTLQNTTPTTPILTMVNTGFTTMDFSFTPATAPGGYDVRYALFLNGVWFSQLSGIGPNLPYTVQWLSPGTTYTAYIAAFTIMRDTAKSNTITFTTPANPSLGALSVSESGSSFILKFKKGTTAAIKRLTLIRNDAQLDATPTSVQTTGDEVTVTYPKSILPPNVNSYLKLEVDFGMGSQLYTTSQVTYLYYNFTPNSVAVFDAWITTSPYVQFNITFKDFIISEYNDWEVIDVAFEQFHYGNLLMPGLGAPNKTYITGNLTMAQVDVLRSGSKGYVIIKDAGGYHKHEFNYTFR